MLGTDANCGLNLHGVAWKDDGAGDGAEVGEAVALVGLELGAIDDEIRVAHGRAELRNDLRREHDFNGIALCEERGLGGEPTQCVGEKALLDNWMEVGAAVEEQLAFAEARGEGARADVAVMVS